MRVFLTNSAELMLAEKCNIVHDSFSFTIDKDTYSISLTPDTYSGWLLYHPKTGDFWYYMNKKCESFFEDLGEL